MQQPSCLEGGPLLWIWPLYLHVNQKSNDDDDDDDDLTYSYIYICYSHSDLDRLHIIRLHTMIFTLSDNFALPLSDLDELHTDFRSPSKVQF